MAEVVVEEEAPRRRPPLAVEALRDKIVEKVKENRVTLIVGDTGCGNPLRSSLFDSASIACFG